MNLISEPIILSFIGGVLYQIFPIIENMSGHNKNKPSQLNWNLAILMPFYGFLGHYFVIFILKKLKFQ